MRVLEIRNIEKHFGSQTALAGMSLSIKEGEFVSLLGPSGCGKTTLLRIIAGLETADSGDILWNGKSLSRLPARDRPFNMVFQRYALFPHLNVFENVAFGLRIKKVSEQELKARVLEALSLVDLQSFASRGSDTLSGGQQQRVALARALVNRPQVLLLDEPLSALDQQLRLRVQAELRLLQKKLGLTFVLVTHDQDEAMAVSDRIAVLNHGVLEQFASPQEIYDRPTSAFCAAFIGRANQFNGVGLKQANGMVTFTLNGQPIQGVSQCDRLKSSLESKSQVQVFVRPDKVRIGEQGTGQNIVSGKVIQSVFRGTHHEVFAEVGGGTMIHVASPQALAADQKVNLSFAPEDTFIFMDEGSKQ